MLMLWVLEPSKNMKFSILKEDITPHIPVYLCGFAARVDRRSEGVHDALFASVVILQKNKTVIIITLDLIGGDRSFAWGIKKTINERFGISEDEIIINFSHTHSAVAVTGDDESRRDKSYSFNVYKSLPGVENDFTEDIKYYNIVKTKIINMIDIGLNNLIDGDAYVLRGRSDFGVSRRYPSENDVLWKPYFNEDCMDPDLYLIKLVDNNGRLHGLLYNYACHATAMNSSNYLISADYPGVVRKVLEKQNPGMVAVFLQGCGADIKPVVSAQDGEFKHCTFEELEESGAAFAAEIQNLLEKSEGVDAKLSWRKINVNLQTKSADIKLYSEIWSAQRWKAIADDPDMPEYMKPYIKKKVAQINEGNANNYIPYNISYLRLDDKTGIIALENEVVSDIGKDIKKIFDDESIIVLGYSNSVGGYIPTKKVISDGGYESLSFMGMGLPGQFVDEIEDIIIGRVAIMIKG